MSTRLVSPLRELDDCGCCEGLSARTPERLFNRPGLGEVAYRSGTYRQFRDTLLARLTSADLPALAELRTRDGDDFTIALCDAWAVVCDVLTFYQERIANESYLRTAKERRSILELAKLIGYQLRPGVSANTVLAFTLERAPGAPREAEATITIEAGLPVQSVPGPNELPRTFETTESIEGRVAWNDLAVQTTQARVPGAGDTQMYLRGTATLLRPGDPILIVGDERNGDSTSMRWDFRILTGVFVDENRGRTRVTWSGGLASAPNEAVETDLRVYALRQRASLFGYNAPDPRTLRLDLATTDGVLTTGSGTSLAWANYAMQGSVIDLDSIYPKIVADSWVVLTASGSAALVKANAVAERTRTAFTVSNKITRITPDVMPTTTTFGLSATAVYAESAELTLAEVPLPIPLYGDVLALDRRVDGLAPGQRLAVSGARLRLRIAGTAEGLQLAKEDGTTIDLEPNDEVEVLAPPVLVMVPSSIEIVLDLDDLQLALGPLFFFFQLFFPALAIRWTVRDRGGNEGTLSVTPVDFETAPASEDGERVHEIVAIDSAKDAVSADRDRTTLTLAASLANVYDRTTVRINANVSPATHGESVSEVLGSGDASRIYQRFVLKQAPLTHVTAPTPSGAASTLQVRVNEILWQERPTLFGAGPDERIYTTRLDDDGFTTVLFGDGVNGARLPTGQDNVRAAYRVGIGLDGLVRSGKLTQLMSRPLGLKEVTNPHPAEGAENPESRDQARRNAPLTVLTLDRAVSLRDYEDFARAFAGIAKAHAAWIWDGDGYGVLITVAGPEGAEIAESSLVHTDLLDALSASGDPNARLRLLTYRPALFRFSGRVVVDGAFIPDRVLADIEWALRFAFSFDARSFGQPVTLSEVVTVVQSVPGVIAVDVDSLYRGTTSDLQPRLIADLPEVTSDGSILPAELLTLDPAPLDKLEPMP
jgi:hypothetical protein